MAPARSSWILFFLALVMALVRHAHAGTYFGFTSPSRGVSWELEQTYTIAWTTYVPSQRTGQVSLAIVSVANPDQSVQLGDFDTVAGSASVQIPANAPVGTVRVLITHLDPQHPGVSDYSSEFNVVGTFELIDSDYGVKFVGNQLAIKWKPAGYGAVFVKIELTSATHGNQVIASSTPNDGSLSAPDPTWSIPAATAPGTDYRIKISIVSRPTVQDSSAPFSIFGNLKLNAVASPLTRGSSVTYTWDDGGMGGQVNLDLVSPTGAVASIGLAAIDNDGTYTHILESTGPTGQSFTIRLSHVTYTQEVSELHDITVVGNIQTTSPAHQDLVIAGSSKLITWTTGGRPTSSQVFIQLFKDGVSQGMIISATNNDGSYTWQVPTNLDLSEAYTIKIQFVSDAAITSTTPEFTIVVQGSFTKPGPDTIWDLETSETVEFTVGNDPGPYVLQLLRGAGKAFVKQIAASTTGPSETFMVPADTEPATDYYVRAVSKVVTTNSFDSAQFRIGGTMSMLTPTAGQEVRVQETLSITWDPAGRGATVRINAIRDGVTISITSSTDNDGEYSWVIPSNYEPLFEGFKIQIIWNPDASHTITSPTFTIFGILTIGTPARMIDGQTTTITWNPAGIPGQMNVYIQAASQEKTFLFTIANQPASSSQSHDWLLAANTVDAGSTCKLIIESVSYASNKGQTNDFTVIGQPKVLEPSQYRQVALGDYLTIMISTGGSVQGFTLDLMKGQDFVKELEKIGGSSYATVAVAWEVTNILFDGGYSFRVTADDGYTQPAFSPSVFAVMRPLSDITISGGSYPRREGSAAEARFKDGESGTLSLDTGDNTGTFSVAAEYIGAEACDIGQFSCGVNQPCIDNSKLCDGVVDCQDGSDEKCPLPKALNCSQAGTSSNTGVPEAVVGQSLTFSCPSVCTSGLLFGCDEYTASSSICRAAHQQGLGTANFKLTVTEGRSTYASCTKNGVASDIFPSNYPKSFTVGPISGGARRLTAGPVSSELTLATNVAFVSTKLDIPVKVEQASPGAYRVRVYSVVDPSFYQLGPVFEVMAATCEYSKWELGNCVLDNGTCKRTDTRTIKQQCDHGELVRTESCSCDGNAAAGAGIHNSLFVIAVVAAIAAILGAGAV